MGGIGWTDLYGGEVLIQEVFGGLAFIGREGAYFSDFRGERVVKVDLMVVGTGRGNVVGGFLQKY